MSSSPFQEKRKRRKKEPGHGSFGKECRFLHTTPRGRKKRQRQTKKIRGDSRLRLVYFGFQKTKKGGGPEPSRMPSFEGGSGKGKKGENFRFLPSVPPKRGKKEKKTEDGGKYDGPPVGTYGLPTWEKKREVVPEARFFLPQRKKRGVGGDDHTVRRKRVLNPCEPPYCKAIRGLRRRKEGGEKKKSRRRRRGSLVLTSLGYVWTRQGRGGKKGRNSSRRKRNHSASSILVAFLRTAPSIAKEGGRGKAHNPSSTEEPPEPLDSFPLFAFVKKKEIRACLSSSCPSGMGVGGGRGGTFNMVEEGGGKKDRKKRAGQALLTKQPPT